MVTLSNDVFISETSRGFGKIGKNDIGSNKGNKLERTELEIIGRSFWRGAEKVSVNKTRQIKCETYLLQKVLELLVLQLVLQAKVCSCTQGKRSAFNTRTSE